MQNNSHGLVISRPEPENSILELVTTGLGLLWFDRQKYGFSKTTVASRSMFAVPSL